MLGASLTLLTFLPDDVAGLAIDDCATLLLLKILDIDLMMLPLFESKILDIPLTCSSYLRLLTILVN
jgi:hypothetical protein